MAPALPLIDANVIVRHLRQDHPGQSPRASAYIDRNYDRIPGISRVEP